MIEAKKYLKQYQEALADIRNLETESKELEDMAMSISSAVEYVNVEVSGKIERQELELYGWDANPWVFVYEFERIEVEQTYEPVEV